MSIDPPSALLTSANLLPAILLAGPPHSGKSVLAHLLTARLRAAQVQHIVLRAAPDGEGDWFHQVNTELRFVLRRKGEFTPQLADRMARAVQRRALPMLVDIGGRPQGGQFAIIDACTHAIHLYREETNRRAWQGWIEERHLIPIAELRSHLAGPDLLAPSDGVLRGVIGGLDRQDPRPGPLFDRLAQWVQGICSYDAAILARQHCSVAPQGVLVVDEGQLGQQLGISQPGQTPWWRPEDLASLAGLLPVGQPLALYGSGPVWLTAAIAAANAPAPLWVFDARHYGWLAPPRVRLDAQQANAQFSFEACAAADHTRLLFTLSPEHHVLTPQTVHVPPLAPGQGVILDGSMPKWLWSALAGALSRVCPWLAAYEPRGDRVVRFWNAPHERQLS